MSPPEPKTPTRVEEQNVQLLTPPPTGGLKKRFRFLDDVDSQRIPKRLARGQENDDVDLYNWVLADPKESPNSVYSVSSEDTIQDLAGDSSGALDTCEQSLLQDKETITTPSIPRVVQPFPLMKLPLNIRNRIYSLLLTVPAMICVRQNRTTQDESGAHSNHVELRPGIKYALSQMSVDGTKFNMSMFRFTNIALLRVSKKVYFETKAIMYSTNIFDIVPPSTELSPSTDYRVCLFPRGCQGLVQKLTIRVRSLYMLQYLMNGAYAHIKNAYRGLQKLTLILELETTTRGFGKLWAKNEGEASDVYVHRLHAKMSAELYGYRGTPKTIPTWITLRVLFDGERYDEVSEPANGAQIGNQASDNDPDEDEAEDARRADLKKGVFQAFEMFKKGAR